MGCLKHKKSKENALEELTNSKTIGENRKLLLGEKEFEIIHKETLDAVNRGYDLNLSKLFLLEEAKVLKFGIRKIPYNRTDDYITIQRVVPIEDSFEKIDERRKELKIYDTKESIGEYRQKNGLTQIKDPYFQTKPESKEAPLEKLNVILREFVANNGGKVQAWDSLLKKYGGDHVAAFNILTRTIDVAKGKEKKDTLPEEVGHFALEGLGEGNLLVNNILNLIGQLDFREELNKIDPDYVKLYKDDELALKKELAGKYLGQAIIGKFETKNNSILASLARTFKLFMDKFFSLFRNADINRIEEIRKEINKQMGGFAEKILSKENLGLTFTNTPTHPVFFQTDSAKKAKEKDHKYKEQELYFERRITELKEVLRKSSDPQSLEKVQENINRLQKNLRDFKETRNKDFLKVMANITLDGIEDYFDYIDKEGVLGVNLRDKNVNYAREALNVLKGFPGVSERVTKLEPKFDEINNLVIQKVVNENRTEEKEITLEEIKGLGLDINRGIQWFGALQDTTNYLSRTIGSEIKTAQNNISTRNKHLTAEVQKEVDALKEYQKKKGISEKDIYKIFIQNYKGTTVLTKPYTTEFYSKFNEALGEMNTWGKNWLQDNTILNEEGDWIPRQKKYYNEDYKTIQNTPELKRFYDFHLKTIEDAKSKLPIRVSDYIGENFIANLKKSITEQIFNTDTSFFSAMGEAVQNILTVNEFNIGQTVSDKELFGEFVQGNRFTKGLEPGKKSDDLGKNLLEFASFANSYQEMSEVLPTVKLLQDALSKQEFVKSSSPGDKITGDKSNVYKMTEDYIQMQVLGKMKKEEGKISWKEYDEEGKETKIKYIHLSEMGDIFLKWNSLLRIGLNPFNALGNLIFGEISNFIESSGGRYFGVKDMTSATKIFTQQKFKDDSVVNKLLEEINPLQELEDFENPTKVRLKKFDGNKLMEWMYSPQKMGEVFIQTRTMLAVMLKQGMLTSEGVITEKGENMLKDEKLKNTFRDKVQRINELLHGRYSSRDAATTTQNILVRAAFQFRKWIPAAVEARIGVERYDVRLGEKISGRYLSYKKGFLYMLGKLQGDINKIKRNEFNENDMYNMKKNMTELALLAASLLLYYGLKGGEDDDEWRKKPGVKFTLNMLNRVVGDLNFYYSPSQWLNITKNALPVSKLGEDLLAVFKNTQYLFDEETEAFYRSGPRKHEHKFWARLADIIPAVKPMEDVFRTLKPDVSYTEPR